MSISFAIESNFKDSVQELKSIKASIENYLTCLQEEIASIRRLQLSLVANPQVKLYNELVKLYYLTQIQFKICPNPLAFNFIINPDIFVTFTYLIYFINITIITV